MEIERPTAWYLSNWGKNWAFIAEVTREWQFEIKKETPQTAEEKLGRELTEKEIAAFFKMHLMEDEWEKAQEVLGLLTDTETKNILLAILVEEYYKHIKTENYWWKFDNLLDACQSLPKEIKDQYLTTFLGDALQSHDLKKAEKVARLLDREITKEELTFLLEWALKEGNLKYAQEVVKRLNRELTKEELTTILEVRMGEGWLIGANEVVIFLNRSLTLKEIISTLKAKAEDRHDSELEETVKILEKAIKNELFDFLGTKIDQKDTKSKKALELLRKMD